MRYLLSIILCLCLWASCALAFPPGFIGAVTHNYTSAMSYIKSWGSSVYPADTPTGGAVYCVRNDGSAIKAGATSCNSATTSMSPTTFNSSTFADKDIIYFSSRGGDIPTSLTPLSGGSTTGNRITYSGEVGNLPTFTSSTNGMIVNVSNVDLIDLTSSANGTTNFEFSGTATGIRTYNLRGLGSGNQAFQHLNSVQVDHYNMYAYGAADEGFSNHNNATVNIYGAVIDNCFNGINYTENPVLAFYDTKITNVGNGGKAIDPAESGVGGSLTLDRCLIVESGASTVSMIGLEYGSFYVRNSIFKKLTTGTPYINIGATATAAEITNNIFDGDGYGNTTSVINNALVSTIVQNNIFYNTTGGVTNPTGVYANIFYNAGSGNGTKISTANPTFTSASTNDYSFNSSSPAYKFGADLSAKFTDDYLAANRRSGKVYDVGAVQVSADSQAAAPSTLVQVGEAQFVYTSGSSIVVPPDASLAVVAGGWLSSTSGNTFTSLTLGGSAFASVVTANTTVADNQLVIFKLANPTAGSQTLSYTLTGTTTEGPGVWIVFFAHASTTVQSSAGLQGHVGLTRTTGLLAADSGDLVFAICSKYDAGGATGDVVSFSGITEKENKYRVAERFWYGYGVATGATTVTCTGASGSAYMSIAGAVFDAN